MPIHRDPGGYERALTTGTTTNAYVTIVDADTRDGESFLGVVKNTDTTNSLDVDLYTRTIYGDSDTQARVTDFPKSITGGGTNYGDIQIEEPVERVLIKVKDTVADSHADFTVLRKTKV